MIQVTTLNQIGMLQECADLESNGYTCVIRHVEDKWWYFKYRHRSNGRTIVAQWKPNYYSLKEGSKILKEVSD